MDNLGPLIDQHVDEMTNRLREVRRHLHMHPEPSGEEFQTTHFLSEQLSQAGIPHRVVPSGRGIIAESTNSNSSPRIVLRADMDALRIHDDKQVPYRSQRDGVMHACGHDAHSTMVLGAALVLHHLRNEVTQPWRVIFQPSEETGEGAREMVAAGAVDNARAILAFHVDPERPVGQVAIRSGELTACCRDLQVIIRGHGGHAARPHHTVDPIAAAVQFISNVYQLVPRSVDSRQPTVVSFGYIRGGDSANVIPEEVELRGTIRTLKPNIVSDVLDTMKQIGNGVAEMTGSSIDISINSGIDAVVNDGFLTHIMELAAAEVVGTGNVFPIPQPSMGGEDFAAYLDYVPGCLLRLGVAGENKAKHFLHSPQFDLDEDALAIGVRILTRALILLTQRQDENHHERNVLHQE